MSWSIDAIILIQKSLEEACCYALPHATVWARCSKPSETIKQKNITTEMKQAACLCLPAINRSFLPLGRDIGFRDKCLHKAAQGEHVEMTCSFMEMIL